MSAPFSTKYWTTRAEKQMTLDKVSSLNDKSTYRCRCASWSRHFAVASSPYRRERWYWRPVGQDISLPGAYRKRKHTTTEWHNERNDLPAPRRGPSVHCPRHRPWWDTRWSWHFLDGKLWIKVNIRPEHVWQPPCECGAVRCRKNSNLVQISVRMCVPSHKALTIRSIYTIPSWRNASKNTVENRLRHRPWRRVRRFYHPQHRSIRWRW